MLPKNIVFIYRISSMALKSHRIQIIFESQKEGIKCTQIMLCLSLYKIIQFYPLYSCRMGVNLVRSIYTPVLSVDMCSCMSVCLSVECERFTVCKCFFVCMSVCVCEDPQPFLWDFMTMPFASGYGHPCFCSHCSLCYTGVSGLFLYIDNGVNNLLWLKMFTVTSYYIIYFYYEQLMINKTCYNASR